MDYLITGLVVSTAVTIAAAIVVSALGDITPRSFKITLYISSILTVILLSILITWIEAGGSTSSPKYIKVDQPVYYRVDE